MKQSLIWSLVVIVSLLMISCSKDDPEIPNEEELITTLNYTLTSDDGSDIVILTFTDLDGDGGEAPIIIGGQLSAETTYRGTIELLNEIESPVEDITLEVQEEADEHQFFYSTTIGGVSIAYDDQDADGNPIGLSSVVETGAVGSGTITVILRHEPDKFDSGVMSGDITNAGGETDIEVTFAVDVE